jgi:hypothetical protein
MARFRLGFMWSSTIAMMQVYYDSKRRSQSHFFPFLAFGRHSGFHSLGPPITLAEDQAVPLKIPLTKGGKEGAAFMGLS